jgi:hypothetical protein
MHIFLSFASGGFTVAVMTVIVLRQWICAVKKQDVFSLLVIL